MKQKRLYERPVLPATTLVDRCYNYMFSGCSNLSSVVCLATNTNSINSINLIDWLNGAGTNATNPTLHVKSSMRSRNWNASGWTIVGDQ